MIGADVQERQETLCDEPRVFMDEGEGTNAHQDHESSLEEFKCCDGSENAPLAAVTVWLFSGVSHE
jgi:hypothetical protein